MSVILFIIIIHCILLMCIINRGTLLYIVLQNEVNGLVNTYARTNRTGIKTHQVLQYINTCMHSCRRTHWHQKFRISK